MRNYELLFLRLAEFCFKFKTVESLKEKFELLIILFSSFPGYEWVGWKNKSMGPLQMDFTFLNIRKFDSVSIHINNHYSKDIQIFSRAKVGHNSLRNTNIPDIPLSPVAITF